MNEVRRRVLVVDDDARVRFVLRGALQGLGDGYEILAAGDSQEALAQVKAQPIDLLITDLRLPRMDGMQLTAALGAENPDLQIVWITAYGCHRVYDAGQRLQITYCLDKPLEIDALRAVVLRILEPECKEVPAKS